jgi:hypothetical protein
VFAHVQPRPPDSTSTSTVSRAITLVVELLEAGRQVELIPHPDSWTAAQRVFHVSTELRTLVAETWR